MVFTFVMDTRVWVFVNALAVIPSPRVYFTGNEFRELCGGVGLLVLPQPLQPLSKNWTSIANVSDFANNTVYHPLATNATPWAATPVKYSQGSVYATTIQLDVSATGQPLMLPNNTWAATPGKYSHGSVCDTMMLSTTGQPLMLPDALLAYILFILVVFYIFFVVYTLIYSRDPKTRNPKTDIVSVQKSFIVTPLVERVKYIKVLEPIVTGWESIKHAIFDLPTRIKKSIVHNILTKFKLPRPRRQTARLPAEQTVVKQTRKSVIRSKQMRVSFAELPARTYPAEYIPHKAFAVKKTLSEKGERLDVEQMRMVRSTHVEERIIRRPTGVGDTRFATIPFDSPHAVAIRLANENALASSDDFKAGLCEHFKGWQETLDPALWSPEDIERFPMPKL
jgi:hypothetical protein